MSSPALESALNEIKKIQEAEEARKRIYWSCLFILIYIGGMCLLLGFGITGIVSYNSVQLLKCNITSVEFIQEQAIIGAQFEYIEGVEMNELIEFSCIEDCIEKYVIGKTIVCWWYPNAEVLSIYGNILAHHIIRTIAGVFLFWQAPPLMRYIRTGK